MAAEDQERGATWGVPVARWKRLAIGAAVLVGLLVIVGLGTGAWAKARLAARHPAPGVLVDMGGYRLHLHCTGDGARTVVMDAGLLDFSAHWAKVRPDVERFARGCTYDRAGLGWSDPGPHPRTNRAMVTELRTLLSRAGVEGPYVLVGHSFGGVNARLFAHLHPDEVSGVALVDSAHEDQMVRLPELSAGVRQTAEQFRSLVPLVATGMLALAPGGIPDRGLPAAALAQYRGVLASSGDFRHAVAELEGMEASFEEVRSGGAPDLGDTPLVVITRGPGAPTADATSDVSEAVWHELQSRLLETSRNAVQIVAARSGHDDRPELVVDVVRGLVPVRSVRPEEDL